MVYEGYFRINSFSLSSYMNVRTKSYDVFVCNFINVVAVLNLTTKNGDLITKQYLLESMKHGNVQIFNDIIDLDLSITFGWF